MTQIPKEYKKMLKVAEKQGFSWGMTKGCHVQVRDPEGRVVAGTGGTPGDKRAMLNFRAELRRGGVVIQ